jgi:hypothetical protein
MSIGPKAGEDRAQRRRVRFAVGRVQRLVGLGGAGQLARPGFSPQKP